MNNPEQTLPETKKEPKPFEFKPGDIKVEQFKEAAKSGRYTIRLTHVPSNVTVQDSAFSRGKLYRDLGHKLYTELIKNNIIPK